MLSTTSATEILTTCRSLLRNHRAALHAADEQYVMLSAYSKDDLVTKFGLTAGDAQMILDAFADVHGEAGLYDDGADPRNPPAGHNYGQSQVAVVGPQG